jgi:hypothetical protein
VSHTLQGHSTEIISRLYQAVRPVAAFFWIHDFFAICPGYRLLRNDVSFCNAPALESGACGICVYGDERKLHAARVRALFDSVPFTVVAPSQAALDLWRDRAHLGNSPALLSEHCVIERGPGARASEPERSDVLRIAYIGCPTVHQGWPVFMELGARLRRNADYQFFHLGQGRGDASPGWLSYRPVTISLKEPDAMIEAIVRERIDVAMVWSVWPETVGSSGCEALAAGALVLTNSASGNVARLVRESGAGFVFGTEQELFAAFDSGEITRACRKAVHETRRPAGTRRFSRMTADLAFLD